MGLLVNDNFIGLDFGPLRDEGLSLEFLGKLLKE
jgi:hypothetical protein